MNTKRSRGKWWLRLGVALASVLPVGCHTKPKRGDPPMEIAESVDLNRFMGDWHVQGFTPTALDKDAFDPLESYAMRADGKIQTTYSFLKGDSEGKRKTYRPVGRVVDEISNAEWRMKFFGVFSAPYLVLYVSEDYEYTIVGHPNRRLAWIMSREREIEESDYQSLLKQLKDRDFDLSRFVRAAR